MTTQLASEVACREWRIPTKPMNAFSNAIIRLGLQTQEESFGFVADVPGLRMRIQDSMYARVIVCSGHMMDRPDRPTPRFPIVREPAVRRAMADIFDGWEVGAADLAISGGAAGADILFGELSLERGAAVRLLLALGREEFVERSVRPSEGNWEPRFQRLCEHADVWIQHDPLLGDADEPSPFERNNRWMLDTATAEVAASAIHALLVWDEQPAGDGPGGTADFADRVRQLGGTVAIVNPVALGG